MMQQPRHLIDPHDPHGDPQGRVAKRVTSFTRRGSRLPASLEALMARHGAEYVIEPPRAAGVTTVLPQWRIDLTREFGSEAPLIVEVGSGHGDHIVSAAAAHPDRHFLALEVWYPGVARTVANIVAAGVDNVRILSADAALALRTVLAPASVQEVWTFFPDPWRKTRHHKRRLVQPEFAATIARLLPPGGCWRLATDWEDYAEHMREVLRRSPHFAPPPAEHWHTAQEWSPRWDGRSLTHFEKRGQAAGRHVRDLTAVRVGDG